MQTVVVRPGRRLAWLLVFALAVGCGDDGSGERVCGEAEVINRFGGCVAARNETDCTAFGGLWGRHGLATTPNCACPTGQENCPCSGPADCLGSCVSAVETYDFYVCDDVRRGTCAAYLPAYGCQCIFDERGVARFLCVE